MLKIINYFLQSIVIYIFFILVIVLRIKISRKIFSSLFSTLGPLFKSKEILFKNLEIFSKDISIATREEIQKNMWKNYGMTFVEYMFLK